jgi:hypothetical protein
MQSYNFILIWLNHATKYKIFDTYRYVLFGAISHAIGLFFGGNVAMLPKIAFHTHLSGPFGRLLTNLRDSFGRGGALHPVL